MISINAYYDFLLQFMIATWSVAITALLYSGYIFLNKSRKTEVESQKWLFIGIGIFLILYGITRILFLCAEWARDWGADLYSPNVIPFSKPGGSGYDFFWRLAALIGLVGLIIYNFVVERYLIRKTKYVFSIIGVGTLIVCVIFGPYDIGLLATRTGPLIMGFSIVILYIYLIFTGEGEVRKKAIIATLGLFVFFLGVGLDSTTGQALFMNLFPARDITAFFVIAGLIIFHKAYE
ncbi:MAG: hypothetical protein ACFFDN_15615 [Candidatus Hodarchaeota archaeon]